MSPQKPISGFFLSFTDEEALRVETLLKRLDYPPGGEGLKLLVLDCLESEEKEQEYRGSTQRVLDGVQEFVGANPQVISAVGGLLSGWLKKRGR